MFQLFAIPHSAVVADWNPKSTWVALLASSFSTFDRSLWNFTDFLGLVSSLVVIGTYHNPLIVLLLPFMITLPLYRTSTLIPYLPKITSHPALHNRTTDSRECLIPGSTCAFLARAGRSGTSIRPSCVLLTFSPFATVTWMGFAVSFIAKIGASTCRKWLLAPESSIAQFLMFAKLVSIVDTRLLGGGWYVGTPMLANSWCAANAYRDLCDCFWCLSA